MEPEAADLPALTRVEAVRNALCYECPSAFHDVADDAYEVLREHVPWSQGSVRVRGHVWPERRLTCLFSDAPGEAYHYSGKEMVAQKWHPLVDSIRERVTAICARSYPRWRSAWSFDTCLCNLYRPRDEMPVDPVTGEQRPWRPDKLSWHADDEKDLIADAPIASVSFGATRRFDLRTHSKTIPARYRTRYAHPDVRTYLVSGSLFVMGAGTQREYVHQVPEERTVTGGRVNLTFRMTNRGSGAADHEEKEA